MPTPHISFAIVWLIGIWLASRIALPTLALGVAAIVAIVGIILSRRSPKPRWTFILVLAATLGALRYNPAQPHFDQTSLVAYNDQQQPIIVEGVVAAEPDVRDKYTHLRVQADKLVTANQPARTVRSRVLIIASRFSDYRDVNRTRAKNVIVQTLCVPEPQASLLAGILLGDDSGIPQSAQDAFCTTGTIGQIAGRLRSKLEAD